MQQQRRAAGGHTTWAHTHSAAFTRRRTLALTLALGYR